MTSISRQRVVAYFFLLSFIEGMLAFAILLRVPSMERNALLFGYSAGRLAVAGGVFLIAIVFGGLAAFAFFKHPFYRKIFQAVDNFLQDQSWFARMGTVLLYVLLLVLGVLIASQPLLAEPAVADQNGAVNLDVLRFNSLWGVIFERAQAVFLWTAVLALQSLLLLILFYFPGWKALRDQLDTITDTLLLLLTATFLPIYWLLMVLQINLFTLIPGWQWEFHLTPLTNRWLVMIVPLLLLAVAVGVLRLRLRPYLSLFLLLVTGYCFQLSFGFLTEGGLDTIRRLYAESWHNVYAHAAAKDPAVLDVIRSYEEDYAEEYYFAMSKPPGVIVFYTLMEKIANLIQPETTDEGRFMRLTWFITFVYPFLSFLPVLFLYQLSKTLRPQDEYALLPSILYIFIPNIILMPLFLDQVLYPLLFLLGGMLAVQLALKPSPWLAALLGVYLFTVNFISLSMLVLAAFVGAILGMFLLADWSRGKLVRTALMGFAILAGLLGAFLFFRYVVGYDFITRAQAALDNHITHSFGVRTNEAIQIEEGQVFYNPGVRQRLEALLMNNMEMLVWVGVPVFLLFLWGSVKSLIHLVRGQGDHLDTFIAAFFITYLAYNILGRTKGEVARLWMFMVPVMVLAAGHALPGVFRQKTVGVMLVVVLQVVTIYLIFRFQGFTA